MSSFKINKLTPNIGAEIIGKNIFDNLTTTVCDKIYEALIENKVIFFRDQKISPIQHINFAKSFGDIEPPHPVYPHVDEYPEIVLLENDEQNPPDTDEWHTDLTFNPNPPFASILYSKIIPQYGGDTLWTCLSSIYEALPIELKKYLHKGHDLLEKYDPEGMAIKWLKDSHKTNSSPIIHKPLKTWLKKPMLLIGGWWDPHLRGIIDIYKQAIDAGGDPELHIGPASHLQWWEGAQVLQLNFFKKHLLGIDNSKRNQAKKQYWNLTTK